jgi:peptidoglycan hydrolase-like protein with peptidoglycan-binding domain
MKIRTLVTSVVVVLAVGGAAVVWYRASAPRPTVTASAPAVSTTTAQVTRGDVTQRVAISGTLGYAGTYSVVNQRPQGILTWVPDPGTAVVRGADLYAVAGTSVVLLYGTTPAYRDFADGMSDGQDVRELKENLVALGMDPNHTITVDDHFSPATTAAIRRWQAARGLPIAQRTGTIPLGQVVFLPDAVRIDHVTATVGATLGPSAPILTGTSTTHVVTAALSTDRQSLLHANDQVMVTLPRVAPITGTVTSIGRVASAGTGGSASGSGSGSSPGGNHSSGSGTSSGPATVPVTIALQLPAASGDLDQAPVQVSVTTAQHRGVLMVPVTALLAKVGGGYQVRVVQPGNTHLVDVQPGLYDDTAGTVEVAGTGLDEGTPVEIPTS